VAALCVDDVMLQFRRSKAAQPGQQALLYGGHTQKEEVCCAASKEQAADVAI
jgi:hypothetical protein